MATATLPATDDGNSQVLSNSEISRQAIDAFWDEVCAAKHKHGIKDVLLIGLTRYAHKGAEEEEPFHCHAGDEMLLHTLASRIIDRLAKRRAERIEKLSTAHVQRKRA